MRYIDITWHHDELDEPYRFISEINTENFETRKLVFFKTAKIGFADADQNSHGIELGTVAVPTLNDILAEDEFTGTAITQETFNQLWNTYVKA